MVARWISSTARRWSRPRRVELGDAPRGEPAGRQGVDADRRDLVDQTLDQAGEPGADRVRGDEAGDRLADRAGQDHQDGRVAALAEDRQGGADEPDRAQQGAVDRLRPGRLVEVREAPRRRPAGVDHEQVETAERGHGAGDGRGGAVRRGEVGGDRAGSSRAAWSVRRALSRATSATAVPSARRAVAIAPPRPPLPPPTRARCPVRPRSIPGSWYRRGRRVRRGLPVHPGRIA